MGPLFKLAGYFILACLAAGFWSGDLTLEKADSVRLSGLIIMICALLVVGYLADIQDLLEDAKRDRNKTP